MSEFQLSLLTIGLVVVAGVYVYGFWQQWRLRRSLGDTPERGSRPAQRQEKVAAEPEARAAGGDDNDPLEGFDAGAADVVCSLLNDATDYVATLLLKTPQTPQVLGTLLQRRFDFGKSVHACGLNSGTGLWERLIPESGQAYRAFKLGLQLVDRTGAVSEMRLNEFRGALSSVAEQLQLDVQLPPVEEAVQRAQQLDRFCADVDQMIGINLLTSGDRKLFGTEVAAAARRLGLQLQADGRFHCMDERGTTLFNLSATDGSAFKHHTLNQSRVDSLTLLLDIPRVENPVHRFDEMVALAQALATALRATLVDDQRVTLGDGALAQIRAQVAAVENLMLAGQITPGSAQALRLFS